MKSVNIQSLLQARSSVSKTTFYTFLDYYGISIKDTELDDLEKLLTKMVNSGASTGVLGDFYVSYKIPQIGKEFDLLRFGRDSIVNIELKSESSVEKIEAQLLRNTYYLNFTRRKVYAFSFVSSSGEFYFLGNNGLLETTNAAHLLGVLAKQEAGSEPEPDLIFNPSDYLVSPFNSTKKFLSDKYFLTHQQEQFRSEILRSIGETDGENFVGITGGAGTGKTLLTYDIAKHLYAEKKNFLIIHCGNLNKGHHKLVRKKWKISPIKGYKEHDLGSVDVLIIDEAQRIRPDQFDSIVEIVKKEKCTCIFSYDKAQTLSDSEAEQGMAEKIEAILSTGPHKLSKKIRSNKEIENFIELLFNCKAPTQIKFGSNITISYFDNSEDAKNYLHELKSKKWEVLQFTPSQHDSCHYDKCFVYSKKTSHQVIGQEFDNVAIAMDKLFCYDSDGKLAYNEKTYYAPTRMLFQNITRARRRLDLVIIANDKVLQRCLAILNSDTGG